MSNNIKEFVKKHNIPRLGFGCMRLPTIGGDDCVIDINATKDMVDAYMQAGYNYFDTAYMYHGGTSEDAVRQAVVERYPRKDFILVDKLPIWSCETKEDVENLFNEQLKRLGVDYIDIYLLHALNHDNNKKCEDLGAWEFCKKMKAEGKIKTFGFSFHGTTDDLRHIMTTYHEDVEIVQLQINYFDVHRMYGEQYDIVKGYDKPIVCMEPVRGGILARLPERIGAILTQANPNASHASWAIRWVADLPEVINVLSGMSNMEQLMDNIALMKDEKPLSKEELEITQRVAKELAELPQVECTYCKYCIDCPEGIPIFDIFEMYNKFLETRSQLTLRLAYNKIEKSKNASACTSCGVCVEVCPQGIDIPYRMKEIASLLDEV